MQSFELAAMCDTLFLHLRSLDPDAVYDAPALAGALREFGVDSYEMLEVLEEQSLDIIAKSLLSDTTRVA